MGTKILQKMREGPYWEGVWPCLDPWDTVRLRTAIHLLDVPGNVPVKCGPHSELFFFLIMAEPVALTKAVSSKPVVPAETLKACVLIGLHRLAAEGEAGSQGSQSPEVAQKSPKWDDGESWSEREGLSSSDFCEHNV